MNKFQKTVRTLPVFFLLLPVFFVLHGYTENFDAIPSSDAFYLLGVYILASFLLFLLGWLLYRNKYKAALFSFSIMAFDFFFGSVQDVLKKTFGEVLITRYVFLLPFSFILFL
ncbi:MAG TPA: hypothetical protein VGI82_03460, partial [Chitinophagaceae bacterium]